MENNKVKKMRQIENELLRETYEETVKDHETALKTNNKNKIMMTTSGLSQLTELLEMKNMTKEEIEKMTEMAKKIPLNEAQIKTEEYNDDDVDDEFVYVEDEENNDDDFETVDAYDIPYDLIPLPSKGLIYPHKKSRLPVSYLNASDEDLITSPNLYLDGKIIDVLLRRKILDKEIRPEDLCKGDRDAIIVWLRSTGYGEKFPVSVKDPDTGEPFETEIDLSQLKIKDFNLIPDKEGNIEFKLPKSGDVVKFRILTHKDDVAYEKLLQKSNKKYKKQTIISYKTIFFDIINDDKKIDKKLKTELEKSLDSITKYIKTIDDENDNRYTRNVTFNLERSIISINGKNDKKFIKNYIQVMPVADSLALRKYMNENTPAMDFKVTVERPENLGGGSFETFLELDNSVFINIS